MDKNSKKKILIAVIIAAIAVVFIPIYIFVLADSGDDNKYTVIDQKIIAMEDGTEGFDVDDSAGNDSSAYNNRVRTFDSVSYTVSYKLVKKSEYPDASDNIAGRELLVEILIPTSYLGVLKQADETIANIRPGTTEITRGGNNYYYTHFNIKVGALGIDSSFIFSLTNINTDDITTHNIVKPLVFIKETTDKSVPSVDPSVKVADTLPSDITCALTTTQADPSNCAVTLSGKEDYFVNLYTGNKKQETNRVPIGILVGLRNQGNGKGIKGLVVPKQVSFMISNSNISKLAYVDNSLKNYSQHQSTDDYQIDIATDVEMPPIDNGTVSGNINENVLNVTITNIESHKVGLISDLYYFASNYFVTELAQRPDYDYSDINVTLISDKYNSNNQQASTTILDSYNYILGNYSSNIDLYERNPESGTSATPLEYGKANINYGSDFAFDVNFSYKSRTDSQGDGLTSLTNYIKIDNNALKLYESYTNRPYDFIPGETTSTSSIKLDIDQNGNQKVYFGFGEWNSNYFDIVQNAPAGCPSSIDALTKDQIMNLYGGPCIAEKNTIQWAYSPMASDDISGNPIETEKGPMIVKSTYVANNGEYILPASSGTLELYGAVVDNYTVAHDVYQIVTSASAYGKNSSDYKYLGNQDISGDTLLTNANNFSKTVYDFVNRNLVSLNSNVCGYADEPSKCAASGVSIITSGIKTTKPVLGAYKPTNLTSTVNDFYYYPIALKVDSASIKSDIELNIEKIYVDVYLPDYMTILDNYASDNSNVPESVENITLANIYTKYGLGAPVADANYKVYHYIINEQGLSNFVVYADIDPINTPTTIKPEFFTEVDYEAIKYIRGQDEQLYPVIFRPISSSTERMFNLRGVTLHNSSTVITRGVTTPKYIEKNGSYTFNMFAYNHSETLVTDGYTYPTADLYYVLPFNGDSSDENMTSKVGSTKYKVNFTEDSISTITNANDYKFYYATTGVPSNIVTDEIMTTSDPSSIWTLWENPTEPVANVVAVKIVKQTPFAPGEYFASSTGLTVNVETVGSTDSNIFYNTFSLLTSKPSNYECDDTHNPDDPDEDYDPEDCEEARNTKDNYSPTSSVTSVYSREITGFVFEDSDYNGIYTTEESKMKDIAVTLYKIDELPENYDENDPSTYVKDTDRAVSSTLTGTNGNYYFGGLNPGYYYVRFTFDNDKYNIADYGKTSDYIPDSINNNSKATLLPNSNKAATKIITFTDDYTDGKNIVNGMNMGLTVKKEMAVKLNKFITEVTVSRNGNVKKYDYSDKNLSQVTISVQNPRDTKIQVKYAFSIENTKYFPGYVGLLVDTMPKDMTFNPNLEENKNWVIYDNTLYYNGLSGKLLLPGEKQYFKLTLDLDLKEAGTYRNVITAKDLTLQGSDLPIYNFDELNNSNTQGGE